MDQERAAGDWPWQAAWALIHSEKKTPTVLLLLPGTLQEQGNGSSSSGISISSASLSFEACS
jgi:hypothetical protein